MAENSHPSRATALLVLTGASAGFVLWAVFEPSTTVWFGVVYALAAFFSALAARLPVWGGAVHGAAAFVSTAVLTAAESALT